MALDEFLKLVGEGPYPMMLLLPGNVGNTCATLDSDTEKAP
jgi:hypothetical protein